jgi:quinol-cytochrome oxidoreductase complex cytochrome b subunit
MRRNFLFHLHPIRVAAQTLKPTTTLGLGVITLTLFLVLAVSGVLLMVYYVPTPREAYSSTQDLQHAVTFGAFVRALHRWAGHAMVLTVFLHLLRVFFTGAYFRRELNWTLGLGLFLLTLGLAFTGYLLPWDQLSIWAITVGSNMARAVPLVGHEGPGQQILSIGGADLITNVSDARFALLGEPEVGEMALNRFYVLHCIAIPLVVTLLSAIHFWRVRKDGGISGPL